MDLRDVAAETLAIIVLVPGAWGCGVFRNDPDHVAGVFAHLLDGPAPAANRRAA